MKILIIDGQSGRLGAQLIEALAARLPMDQHQLIAIGANSLATSAMLKAGAQQGAPHRHCHSRRAAGRDHPQHGGGRRAKRGNPRAAACKPLCHPGSGRACANPGAVD